MIARLRRKRSAFKIGSIGAGALFLVVYIAASSSLYFGLGLIAEQGKGLTPLLMVAGAVFFGLTLMSYLEGSSLHVERGGASSFARYAFNELWSFIAGWAILLDYAVILALVASTVPNYLSVFWSGFGTHTAEMILPALLIVAVAAANVRGVSAAELRKRLPFGWLDMFVLFGLIVIGLAMFWHPARLIDTITLGDAPNFEGVVTAVVIATVAGTGLEASSGLAGEIRIGRGGLKNVATAGSLTTLIFYGGVSLVALMAVPVMFTTDGAQTALATTYVEYPIVGITKAMTPSWLADAMTYLIGAVATLTLMQAARIFMLGPLRLSYALATHRQVPRLFGRLHPRYGTPYVAAIAMTVIASGLTLFDDPELLVAIFAFGSLLTFTIANVAICVLRYREPAANTAFRVPLSIPLGKGSLPLPSLLAAIGSAAAFIGVLAYRPTATTVGTAWLVGGLLMYVIYRRSQGQSLLQRLTVPEQELRRGAARPLRHGGYGSILVPVFGGVLDDDIVGTAGRLAMEEAADGEGGAMIEALHVIEIPMSRPIDAPVPEERLQRARRALARAKEVGEEYAGVEVATATVRARSTGEAIVREAARRGVEAIVLAAERPSRVRGGPLLGGVEPRAAEFVGRVSEYVARKALCQVILTAPPESDVRALVASLRHNPHVSEAFAAKQQKELDRLRAIEEPPAGDAAAGIVPPDANDPAS